MGGGLEKRGGRKTSRMTPSQKGGLDPPPRTVLVCFSCTEIHDKAEQKLFWRGPKIFGRARCLVRVPPPIRFSPPPYHGPNVRLWSEKLEKAGTVDFKKHPARKVGTRSRQCRPNVPGRFAFPGVRNPRLGSISQFGKLFLAIFPKLSWSSRRELPQDPGNSHSLLQFSGMVASAERNCPKKFLTPKQKAKRK